MLNGSGDKPVFATSEIAGSVDPAITIPLDGIEFIQMPWLLGQSNDLNLNAAQLAKLPSARGGGSRLNAFGLDAWLITTHLNAWLANPNGTFNGATGSLHLEPNGRIERQLPWMIYRGGVPQAADVR
jgi:outer membrane PBP1 activator LpoA protein